MYLRPAVAADAERVAQVVRAAAVAGYAGLFPPGSAPPPIEEFVAGWRTRIADDASTVIVAAIDGGVCGVAAVVPDVDAAPSGRLLERLYVDPGAWAGGVGSALHDAAVRAAMHDGATALHLWVLEGNERARRMYERRGWHLVSGVTATPEGVDIVEVQYELTLPGVLSSARGAVEISPARPNDAGEILTLQRAAFLSDAQLYDDPNMASLTQPLAEIEAMIADDDWVVLVGRIGFRIVGSVRASLADGVADIGRLMTAPDLQGRGIGRALMTTIEAMVAADVGRFRLHTGARSHDTIAFYERLGYRLVDDPTVPHDAVTMIKPA